MSGISTNDILSGTYAAVNEGKLTGKAAGVDKATEEVQKAGDKAGGALDKDAFLKLLVAQMKNQDPLEPQDNSQMVSQLATFSSLEEMQNMSQSMDKSRASSLIGQVVSIEHKDASGNMRSVEGVVDFVSYQGSKTFVSVDGTLYDIEEVNSVLDEEYMVATKVANAFITELNKLPNVERLTLDHVKSITDIMAVYSSMTDYQKSMIGSDAMNAYNSYAAWLAEIAPENVQGASENIEEA